MEMNIQKYMSFVKTVEYGSFTLFPVGHQQNDWGP